MKILRERYRNFPTKCHECPEIMYGKEYVDRVEYECKHCGYKKTFYRVYDGG